MMGGLGYFWATGSIADQANIYGAESPLHNHLHRGSTYFRPSPRQARRLQTGPFVIRWSGRPKQASRGLAGTSPFHVLPSVGPNFDQRRKIGVGRPGDRRYDSAAARGVPLVQPWCRRGTALEGARAWPWLRTCTACTWAACVGDTVLPKQFLEDRPQHIRRARLPYNRSAELPNVDVRQGRA
jgi:hypothetical protein